MMNAMNATGTVATNRRTDPDYGQISGLIPKTLIRQFKIAMASTGLTQSEALEQAVEQWVERQEI